MGECYLYLQFSIRFRSAVATKRERFTIIQLDRTPKMRTNTKVCRGYRCGAMKQQALVHKTNNFNIEACRGCCLVYSAIHCIQLQVTNCFSTLT